MFKSCLKLCVIKQFNRNLLEYPRVSSRIITGKRFCSKKVSDESEDYEKMGKSIYIHRQNKVINEIQLIKYENRFQDQRYDKLSPINASDYKSWLTKVCLKSKETSIVFDRKFRRIKLICQVYNEILQKTFRVPSKLTTNSIIELLEIDSLEDITKQINYLYDLEMKRWIEKQSRKEDVIKTKSRLELKYKERTARIGLFDDKNELIYGLWHNTLFTRIQPKSNRDYITKTRLNNSAIFGQKIVIDFGFEEFLYKISAKQVMSYLVKTLSFNKYNLKEPFDLYFNNFNSSGFMSELIERYFHKTSKHDLHEYYIDCKSDSYLNHFDFSNLCYICPQADQPLKEYDHNAVYVLPAVVHNRMDPPLSMMRVKHEGIQMKRIPVEDYGLLKDNYHLELHLTLKILSHFREYNDINKAFELYLPKTVWKRDEEVEDEDQMVINQLFYQKMIGSQRKTKVYRRDE